MVIHASYDEEADVLYLSIDKPKPALTEDLGNGVLLRRDPVSSQWVGVTIMDFLDSFAPYGDMASLRQHGVPEELVQFVENWTQ